LTAETSTPPEQGDPTMVPHGVEPKALVVGPWLVVIGGREGLFLYYTPAAGIRVDGIPSSGWQRFNIAKHHNIYFKGTDQAFSESAVSGRGGDSETTGYMGATPSADEKAIVVCYDRTVSHSLLEAPGMHFMSHFNTIYCIRLDAPTVA
jgi:hypothetical protein